ncbi:putative LOC107377351-like protein [Nothobranchius furzeri]|uniref:LOC107377351-like protein n=1 Tax=Nothobranchius furzeri TaxID=105023 RepID=A0A9D3C3N5_NOTFU|nr:putative LOC107377351-like protein [Nothobranchius furzeri]
MVRGELPVCNPVFSEPCLQVGVSESYRLQLILSSRPRGFKEECDTTPRRMITLFGFRSTLHHLHNQLGLLQPRSRCLLPWPPTLSHSPTLINLRSYLMLTYPHQPPLLPHAHLPSSTSAPTSSLDKTVFHRLLDLRSSPGPDQPLPIHCLYRKTVSSRLTTNSPIISTGYSLCLPPQRIALESCYHRRASSVPVTPLVSSFKTKPFYTYLFPRIDSACRGSRNCHPSRQNQDQYQDIHSS